MARTFDGSASALKTAGTQSGPSDWTVAAWVYPDAKATGPYLIWNRDNGGTPRHFQFRIYQNNLEAIAFSTTAFSVAQNGAIATGAWQHVAGAFAGTTVSAYVNGGTPGTASRTGTHRTDSVVDTIGAFWNGGSLSGYFDGNIAWPCLWNVGLSSAEIDALAAGAHPLTIRPANIVRFYPLTGASSGNEIDIISGASLVESGTVGQAEGPLVSLGGAWPVNYTPAAGGGATVAAKAHHHRMMLSA